MVKNLTSIRVIRVQTSCGISVAIAMVVEVKQKPMSKRITLLGAILMVVALPLYADISNPDHDCLGRPVNGTFTCRSPIR